MEADRILDAPSVTDDFYLNLMDWGPNNQLAVALDNVIFIWNAETAEIKYVDNIGLKLFDLQMAFYLLFNNFYAKRAD